MTSMVSWLLGGAPRAGSLDPFDDRYYDLGRGSISRAGVRVSADTAMKVSTVYRCVSILANVLAMFPKGMYERLDRGRRPAPDHPIDPIISFKPNRRQNAFVFWRQVCYHLVLRQNAFVQIIQGPKGRGWVGELVPLDPDRVAGPEELADGTLRYTYTRPNGEKYRLIGDVDIWHLQGLSSDGLRGLSMLDVASDSVGLALASERHAARFFERGVKPTGVLQHEKTLTPETARQMSQEFGAVYGGEGGTGKIPVLWDNMKFQPISMTLKDAEFLDSRKFSVSEIARWFGVPPHMVGDVERSTSWGTGIEQQGLHFLIYSLLPWIELIEQSIRFSLVVQADRYYPKMNVNAILRMDARAQAGVFSILIDKGVLSPNECRELLERNPRPGGDEYKNVAAPQPLPVRAVPSQQPEPQPAEPAPPDPGADPPAAARVGALLADPDAQLEAIAATLALQPITEPTAPDRALAVAETLAWARAEELLGEEDRTLADLRRRVAPTAFDVAARRFYGHFAVRISEALACSRAAARAWCDARRATKVSREEAQAQLVALALTNGGS